MHSLQARGREWLWNNPHLPFHPMRYGVNWVKWFDTGGWDEVFPSVSPVDISPSNAGGTTLKVPDHGDLVTQPWSVDSVADERVVLSVNGRCAPFRFQRTWRLDGPMLHSYYELTGTRSFPWIWAAHPQFSLANGLQLDLPAQTPVLIRFALGKMRFLTGRHLKWEELHAFCTDGTRRSILDGQNGEPWALKLFTEASSCQTVKLRAPEAELAINLDTKTIPHFGLWINSGGWSGSESAPYRNIVIEPTTAAHDSLAEAILDGSARVLNPDKTYSWSFTVKV